HVIGTTIVNGTSCGVARHFFKVFTVFVSRTRWPVDSTTSTDITSPPASKLILKLPEPVKRFRRASEGQVGCGENTNRGSFLGAGEVPPLGDISGAVLCNCATLSCASRNF